MNPLIHEANVPVYSGELNACLEKVSRMGTRTGMNAVAFSGGVDSSLTAWLVKEVFGDKSVACLGLSAALPDDQRTLAHRVARHIGIPLEEIETLEGQKEGYVANAGQACFYCKSTLYATLDSLCQGMLERLDSETKVVLYNGTNLDDRADETRVGLKAAANFKVQSPLDHLPKAAVRQLSREVGLPNWSFAASPCLRSRLQYGVEATPDRLARTERAESVVRRFLSLQPTDNLRVRTLEGDLAMIEVDAHRLGACTQALPAIRTSLTALGFYGVDLRPFRSGSLSRPG